ncbi:MAG: RimK/LysX family protein [Verrucomicrobiota bacterium JB023]|nr:RimK/LysX family protein [Verrucomicrobiota bacterium JB023]
MAGKKGKWRVVTMEWVDDPGEELGVDRKLVIGRREWIGLPALGIEAMHGKTDTGAYNSSIHAEEVSTFDKEGEEWVSFLTHAQSGKEVRCEAPVSFRKRVKSSTGVGRMRIFVRTKFRSPRGLEWQVDLSLADRREMQFPLLIGRRALKSRFVVDTSRSHLLGPLSGLTGHGWRQGKKK